MYLIYFIFFYLIYFIFFHLIFFVSGVCCSEGIVSRASIRQYRRSSVSEVKWTVALEASSDK